MMSFTNTEIPPGQLPAIENVEFNPLESNYLKAERLSFFISLTLVAIIVAVAFYFIPALQAATVMYPVVLILTVFFLLYWLGDGIGFRYSGYALRENDLLFRNGWLFRKTRIVPLNRIQHVSVQSGPIERRFGLASISVYTAGASNADFTIKGISALTAGQIKEWVSRQLDESNSAEIV